jgi:Amt family ammonium transporter
MPELSAGDTAWVLASSALVLLMTPGLALFYGGMVRAKGVLNMLMMNFAAIAVVSVLWVLYGYSLALSTDIGGGLLGGLGDVGLRGLLGEDSLSGTIPSTVFVAFQAMFAIITVALISGAIADRTKFSAWLVFIVAWATLVYFPVAHWVFFFDDGNGGWIGDRLGAVDFAGSSAALHSTSTPSGSAGARSRCVRTTFRWSC